MADSGLSALCVACGLCCDGSLFRFLPVEPGDVPRHDALGLPVVTQSGRLAMPLPCAKLVDRCCTVYAARPNGCRTFVCHLGHRLEQGDVSFPAALSVVQEAQRRISALQTAWPWPAPVVQRATAHAARTERDQAAAADPHAPAPGSPESAASLEAVESVHAWLDEHLHWPDGPITGT